MFIFEVIGIVIILLGLLLLIRNAKVLGWRCQILDAIYNIRCYSNEHGVESDVDYSDMESYTKTLFRFWDWGCEHILPEEKYCQVKHYLSSTQVTENGGIMIREDWRNE